MPSINKEYYEAYHKFYDNHYTRFANNILNYCDENKIKVGSVLDLSSKTGKLLSVFQVLKYKTSGSDTSKAFCNFAREKYPKIEFKQSEEIEEIPFKGGYDLIHCGDDYLNSIKTPESLTNFLKNVSKHLSNKGLFVLSFYSNEFLSKNKTIFNSSSNVDCVKKVNNLSSNKTEIQTIFYNNKADYTTKSLKVKNLNIFQTDEVCNELKNAGFTNVIITNYELKNNSNFVDSERIYILATKK